jgi:hypothetical protein
MNAGVQLGSDATIARPTPVMATGLVRLMIIHHF